MGAMNKRAAAILVASLTAVALACNPGTDVPASDAAAPDSSASDGAPTTDATTDGGGSACNGGKPATPALVTSMTTIIGGWRFANLRGIDGKDKPLGDTVCDPSIDYYFNGPSAAPGPVDSKTIDDAACAAANGVPITVIGGTDTKGYPNCPVLACGPGTLGMLWDDTVQTGRVYAYDANKKQGPLVATIRFDNVDAGRLLFIQGSTTWSMTGGVYPTCN